MILDRRQEGALDGKEGAARRWAMEVLVALGDRTGAERMVPVSSVHLPDWNGDHSGEAWEALRSIAGTASLPITANPGCAERHNMERRQLLEGLRPHGCYTFSCAPYLSGNHPARGSVVAWGGRAASAFANSVLGARGERETFETAVAAAVMGITPERGVLIEQNRIPTVAVTIPSGHVDLRLLGWQLSRQLVDAVPMLCGAQPTFDEAKRLALAMNSRGSMPLFHMSRDRRPPTGLEAMEVTLEPIDWGRNEGPDLVILGCPHLSEQDINRWSKKLEGRRRTSTEAWFFTSRLCHDKCPVFGAVLRSRGRVFVDQCPRGMVDGLRGRVVACDSPAMADCLSDLGVAASYLPDDTLFSYLAL